LQLPSLEGHDMKLDKVKDDVKGVLTQKVRLGFFTVPVWLLATVLILRQVRSHRRAATH
jgi:hypothetical protein